jgi:hypothetical protein
LHLSTIVGMHRGYTPLKNKKDEKEN